ncbi:MAG: hypothetical protein ACTSRS_12940 [Candidatus Helarchaeota archaeon]
MNFQSIPVTGDSIPLQLGIQSSGCPYNIVWERKWNASALDFGIALTPDLSGNIWVVGSTGNSLPQTDQLLLIYNSSGSLLMNSTYGGGGWDQAFDITMDRHGNLYMCGFFSFAVDESNATIFVFFPNGSMKGVITWGWGGLAQGLGLAIDIYDNLYLMGRTDDFSVGFMDLFVAKFDSNGNLLWNTTWGTTDYDFANDIVVDGNNNTYVIGTFGFGTNTNATLTKLDADGNIDWIRTLGDYIRKDEGYGIAIENDTIYITGFGETWGAVDDQNIFIAKYDLAGNQEWLKTWAGAGGSYDRSSKIEITPNHNLLVIGYTNNTGAGKEDMLLLKFDSNGILLWADTFGMANNDGGMDIISVSETLFYTTGYTEVNGAYKTWLIKFTITADETPVTNEISGFVWIPALFGLLIFIALRVSLGKIKNNSVLLPFK